MKLLLVVDVRNRFLCRRIILIIVRTAGQEWLKIWRKQMEIYRIDYGETVFVQAKSEEEAMKKFEEKDWTCSRQEPCKITESDSTEMMKSMLWK